MDEKWVEQAGQDQMMVEDRAWLFRDWVAGHTGELRDVHDDGLARRGKAQWIVTHPALAIFPVLGLGACLWLLVIGLLVR